MIIISLNNTYPLLLRILILRRLGIINLIIIITMALFFKVNTFKVFALLPVNIA